MPCTFECISKKMVKTFGGKDLQPVKSLLDGTHFRQFSILRKNSQSRFWEPPETLEEFSLMDILAPVSSVPETVVTGPFYFSDNMIQRWKVGVGVDAGVDGSVSGETTWSRESTLEIRNVSIPSRNLECLQNSKLLDPEPTFLKTCRSRRDKLYVVTEVVELTDTAMLQDNSSVNALGKLSMPWNTFIKGEVQGQVLKDREWMLTIPQGTVLAYKRKQLVIEEKSRTILLTSTDTKQKTFQDELAQTRSLICTITSIAPKGRIEEPLGQDFKCLEEEISWEMEALSYLSKDVQDVLFYNMLPMLRDRGALQDMMNMLELDGLGHLDGPGGIILNKVQQDSRYPWGNLQKLLLYILQAIMVLSDTQLELLAQSMEKRILLQQRELVRSILEPNFKYPWSIPFTLPSELLAPLQAEDLAITYGLLKECGLKMELNSPKSTWDLEAKMPLSALYGILSLLQQLAEA